jgi:23S rRNA (cytidine1920-2'-O)/16S rRNA (cytidine1409-2'-O)-methyltransferase
VLVRERPVTKAGTLVEAEVPVRLRQAPRFVGRGGEKLDAALDDLAVEVRDCRILDLGASTGGFTDCLLQRGAARVTALDVGRGQLDWQLRTDERVAVVEGVNARHLEPGDFPEPFDLVTIDVSFISLDKILPAAAALLRPDGRILALVKPQFELQRGEVGPRGVVRDPSLHLEAILKIARAARKEGLAVRGLAASRLPGAQGNREFFLLLVRAAGGLDDRTLAEIASRPTS